MSERLRWVIGLSRNGSRSPTSLSSAHLGTVGDHGGPSPCRIQIARTPRPSASPSSPSSPGARPSRECQSSSRLEPGVAVGAASCANPASSSGESMSRKGSSIAVSLGPGALSCGGEK